MNDILTIKKEAAEIQKMYSEDTRQDSFNLLLLGGKGTGKSRMAITTSKQPVHVDSFDPGGTKLNSIQKLIGEGKVLADTSFEGDDPFKPFAWNNWKKALRRRLHMKYFDHIGTYVLDSSTLWSSAIMNFILDRSGIAGEAPRFTKDYGPQKVLIINWLKVCLSLPCDFILIGHLEGQKDKEGGVIKYCYMTTGKGEVTIPIEFDEQWLMTTKEGSKGLTYRVLTQNTGMLPASTRLGEDVFDTYEKPDIKYLLKKAGRDFKDKPLLTD